MANLLGQNIGTNYKGFLNLGSTINTPLDTTLRSVTDGDGNSSPLRLSTTSFRLQNSTGFTGPFLNWRVPDNNSFWLDFRGFNDSGGTYSIFATDRLIIGRNPGLAGFDSATLGLSQTGIFIGGASNGYAIARLQVKGDGTNPIARFENNSGASSLSINASGTFHQYGSNGAVGMYVTNQAGVESISGQAINWYSNITSFAGFGFRMYGNSNHNYTSGTGGVLEVGGNIVAAAGSANFRPLSIAYNINNSGAQTGTATGIFLNATETALNGMTHNLMDLQVGGSSRFRVLNTGGIQAEGTSTIQVARMGFINDSTNAVSVFSIANTTGATTFGGSIFRFGGTTNAFPAIKRNGAAIDFRLADDSAFTGVSASLFTANYVGSSVVMNLFDTDRQIGTGGAGHIGFKAGSSFTFSNINLNVATASAMVEITSTTKGFLPPRMTTTQRDLIATPAAGLMIYNTTTNRPNFYDGSAWVAL